MFHKIKIGDVVQLSCGGPFMTVESFTEDNGRAVTVWIHGKEKAMAAFDPATLVVLPTVAGTISDA